MSHILSLHVSWVSFNSKAWLSLFNTAQEVLWLHRVTWRQMTPGCPTCHGVKLVGWLRTFSSICDCLPNVFSFACPHCYGEKWNLNCAHWALPPFPGDLSGSLLVQSHIAYNLRRLPTGTLQWMTHRAGLLGNEHLFVVNDLQSVGGLMRVYGIFEG